MTYSVTFDSNLVTLQDWHPGLVWVDVQFSYTHLSHLLCELYRGPASDAEVERNHKTNKRVQCAWRGRI